MIHTEDFDDDSDDEGEGDEDDEEDEESENSDANARPYKEYLKSQQAKRSVPATRNNTKKR